MKQKILLSIVMAASITGYAQTEKKVTGYAVTGPLKGQSTWNRVRLIDMNTGEEMKTIFSGDMLEIEILNARTGKPIIKKDKTDDETAEIRIIKNDDQHLQHVRLQRPVFRSKQANEVKGMPVATEPTVVPNATTAEVTDKTITIHLKNNLNNETSSIIINRNINEQELNNRMHFLRNHFTRRMETNTDAPFATGSAALAYDKKHERLYYTPMGINQLRYIDLKSKTPKVYYFEDEAFGTVTSYWDAANQITRMVIASDGNGYALTNNNEHLIRFTTGKKPEITDLGTLTDDVANGEVSINSRRGYGGDIIADAAENLYLINANHKVFKIAIETKIATYVGTIEGLPQGYGTNGAMVEGGSKIIVCSAESTEGYYRVDLATLQSEKLSTNGTVFNASDLANGNLAFDKKDEKQEEIMPVLAYQAKAIPTEGTSANGIVLYPNPVFDRMVKLSFANQPAGEYKIQLMELSGRVISSREITINSKIQQIQFSLPQSLSKGSYLVKTVSDVNKVSIINKLIVE